MVLNGTWTGPGAAFSQFPHPFAAPGGPRSSSASNAILSAQVRAYTAEPGRRRQTIYASITGTGDINGNSHGRLADYEIVFPTSCSQYARDGQLLLRDLQGNL
jgi:hypothetical protein